MTTHKKCDKCPSPAMYYIHLQKKWSYLCDEHFDQTKISKYELDSKKSLNEK